ncbi:MAG: type II secretion system F family protein [Actinomycetota bacterium]
MLVFSVLLIAVLAGLGLVMMVGAFAVPRATLDAELRHAQRAGHERGGLVTSIADAIDGLSGRAPDEDLAILEWSRTTWNQRRLTFAAVGFVVGALVSITLRLLVTYPLVAGLPLLGLLVGGIGLVVADSDRQTKASDRRDEMRLALSYFLEVASIMLAGGAGAETAMEEAASKGVGPSFRMFAQAVARAQEDPRLNAFVALRDLGEQVGVRELVEFGDVMILSSENSATVRQALQDKASILILREQENRKTAALARNVAMSIPVAGIAGGFIIWLVYPAIAGLANF